MRNRKWETRKRGNGNKNNRVGDERCTCFLLPLSLSVPWRGDSRDL